MLRWLATLLAFALAAAKKEVEEHGKRPLSPAEIAHKRKFFSIGEGFEGSASDWTEYVVWLIGVVGVFFYMSNPNARRNLHAVQDDDEPKFQQQARHGADGDDFFADDADDDERDADSPAGKAKVE